MCDVINPKSYGSGLTDVTGVRKRIFYIVEKLYIYLPIFIWYTVARDSLIQPPNRKVVSGNTPPQ